MKKIMTLALASAFTVASYSPASAVEIKADGEWLYQFQTASEGFTGENTEFTSQRVRLGFSMAVSEQLSGYLQLSMEDEGWGTRDYKHGSSDIDARQVYIDWNIPNTDVKVRMGRHAFDMPGNVFCSPVITDMVSEGIVVDLPINDNFSVTGFWTRANFTDGEHTIEQGGSSFTYNADRASYDIFGVVGNASFDSFSVSPWFIYGNQEEGSQYPQEQGTLATRGDGDVLYGEQADLYVFGMASELKLFDPFTLALDAAYGTAKYGASSGLDDDKGWFVAASASYALDFAEPAFKVWYASGDDKGDRAMSGHLPSIFGDSDASNMFFNGAPGIVGGHRTSIGGTWGVSAQLNGLSFVENLTHDLSVTYIAGTNDKNNTGDDYGFGYDYMTTKDSAIEFAAVNTYEIYKNLSAIFEAAYIIEDYDNSTGARSGMDFENDWRMSLTFAYTF